MDNNIFPLPFEIHLIFVCVALLIFIIRFIMTKRTYQLLLSVAVALTMAIYLNVDKSWYNIWYDCIGIIELVLVVGSLVSIIMDRKKNKALKKNGNSDGSDAQIQEAAQ